MYGINITTQFSLYVGSKGTYKYDILANVVIFMDKFKSKYCNKLNVLLEELVGTIIIILLRSHDTEPFIDTIKISSLHIF